MLLKKIKLKEKMKRQSELCVKVAPFAQPASPQAPNKASCAPYLDIMVIKLCLS